MAIPAQLIDKNGNKINLDDEVIDFRGNKCIVRGWYEKPFPSTGRVVLEYPDHTHPYYPSVINAQIIERAE